MGEHGVVHVTHADAEFEAQFLVSLVAPSVRDAVARAVAEHRFVVGDVDAGWRAAAGSKQSLVVSPMGEAVDRDLRGEP
jgi:hypothetical protein